MAPNYRFIYRQTDAERDDHERHTAGLGGLAVSLALVVAGLFLVKHLHHVASVEDCLLQGRINCDLLVGSLH